MLGQAMCVCCVEYRCSAQADAFCSCAGGALCTISLVSMVFPRLVLWQSQVLGLPVSRLGRVVGRGGVGAGSSGLGGHWGHPTSHWVVHG